MVETLKIPAAAAHTDDQVELSRQEVEIIRAIACGARNEEIARDFHLSVHEVEHMVAQLLRKTRVVNSLELVLLAVYRGVLHTCHAA